MTITLPKRQQRRQPVYREIADAMVYTSLDIRFDRTGFHRLKYSRNAKRVAGYARKSNEERIVTRALCTAVAARLVAN